MVTAGRRRRFAVAARLAAAVLGGYAIAAAATAAVAALAPGGRLEAVLAGTMAGFLVAAGAVVWAFAARSVARAWLGIALPAAALGGLALVAAPGGSG